MIDMIGTPIQLIQWLYNQNKDELYEIKEYKEKRSLSQNAYCWKLIMLIANTVRKSKEEVYMQMLKDYGQHEVVSILSSISPEGYFKYYEKIGTGSIKNKEFTHYKIYKGSSEYETKEMSIFIDGVVQEAQQLGIQTLTPNEILMLRGN